MKKILSLALLINSYVTFSQETPVTDSIAFMDSITNEIDAILDGMMKSKSFLSVGIGAGTGFFNFKSTTASQSASTKKLMFSPAVSYMHKSGLGLSVTGYAVSEPSALNVYQFSFTPSYDYIKRGRYSTGLAFTRYFTKKDLSFYTTPIRNEVYAYFNYKKPLVQPGIALGYGWGSRRQSEQKKLDLLRARRLKNPRLVTVINDESISDLSLLLSLRHDFIWQQIFGKRDLFAITPVAMLSCGTQNFGFNTSFQSHSKAVSNFLPANQYIQDKRNFDTQSSSIVVKADYSAGIFFLQSQVLFDYYLHSADNRFNNAFAVIAGVNF